MLNAVKIIAITRIFCHRFIIRFINTITLVGMKGCWADLEYFEGFLSSYEGFRTLQKKPSDHTGSGISTGCSARPRNRQCLAVWLAPPHLVHVRVRDD